MTKELTNDEKAALDQEIGSDDSEVKGPDPKVWGHDKDRPKAEADIAPGEYLDDNGDPMEVKGPDPEQHPKKD